MINRIASVLSLALIVLLSNALAFQRPLLQQSSVIKRCNKDDLRNIGINTIQIATKNKLQTDNIRCLDRRHALVTRNALPVGLSEVGTMAKTAFQTAGVQKVLELSVIAGIGSSLRNKLDPKAITALLLSALVPSVIALSLSSLTLSLEMGYILLFGACLTLGQIASGELASRIVVKKISDTKPGRTIRRTAAMQLGSMAPALSVFSFVREFVGGTYPGLAALADIPGKLYILIFIRNYLSFRGVPKNVETEEDTKIKTKLSLGDRTRNFLKDPFNLAISTGLGLAAIGRPLPTLGFFGQGIKTLSQAQTAILFLLIGLKFKVGGERPRLCLRLLLARHGFMNLITSTVLATFLRTGEAARLTAVLCSQAACSIIAFGQISKMSEKFDGYDTDLAFDIVALSYPITICLNTAACLGKEAYVNALPYMGVGFLFLSGLLGKFKLTSGLTSGVKEED